MHAQNLMFPRFVGLLLMGALFAAYLAWGAAIGLGPVRRSGRHGI